MRKISTPLFFTNFKTYIEGTGKRALGLAKIAELVSSETGIPVVVAPQFTDIEKIAKSVNIPVFAQHVDTVEPGKYTGQVVCESIKEAGAVGSMINHTERPLSLREIEGAIRRCRENELLSCVCANSVETSVAIATMRPDFLMVEPPELIGTGTAVSKARPEILTGTVTQVRKINQEVALLCGAGITSKDDVATALRLGMQGVGATNGFVKASSPEAALRDMISGMRKAQ